MQTQTTPLETYYLAHGRKIAPLGDLSQRLFNSAFAINLESKAIDDLQHRFSHDNNFSMVASDMLTGLLFTHKHKLLAALGDEEQLLADTQIEAPRSIQVSSTHGTGSPLAALAERNLALTRELALGRGGSGRAAETIASEPPNVSLIDTSIGYAFADQSLSNGPLFLAVDGSGNLWVLLNTKTMTEFVGVATPAVTPLASAVKSKKLGEKRNATGEGSNDST
jgi:hypothetical protein